MMLLMTNDQNRRKFLGTAAATTAAFTIVPRHVLGGPGVVAPSDKITLGHIGTGTEGLREIQPLLAAPEIQIISVCDPNRHAIGYRDWSKTGLRDGIRRMLGDSNWTAGAEDAIPGGRDAAKNIIDTYYSKKRSGEKIRGCSTYADFREMLDKEKDLNAVKIMTPDHLHGVIGIAAMKKGKHVIMHKPIANRLKEAKLVIDTARETGVSTHFMPWDSNGSMEQVMAWIKDGAIGTLREVHNWSNRPMWPQYATIPTDAPPVPKGFDWDLWLGPEADRPYHPNYTHAVFRGWYDFGGGSMADMGHYSLWTVFNALELSGPASIEPVLSHNCVLNDNVAVTVKNDFSFPTACSVRFRYPAKGQRAAIDLIWYDGGMRPPTPGELDEDDKEFPIEGMMFVGDKGKILAGFRVENPRLIPEKRMRGYQVREAPPRRQRDPEELSPGLKQWIAGCRGGKHSAGSFLNAGPISEAVNLYSVALRSRQRLKYDAANMSITNVSDANKYLARDYRKGWELKS
jgi:GFO/IDH/MocA oxidoreductase family protein